MNTISKHCLVGSLIGLGVGIATAILLNNERNKFTFIEDRDTPNNASSDQKESVNASKDSSEKGLTQLDSAYKDEWQANGFPQTHKEMKELEEDGKLDTYPTVPKK